MASARIVQTLKNTMKSSLLLYESADVRWFDALADDVTVYAIGRSEPFSGRAAYEQSFKEILESEKRKVKVLHQDIKILDSTAIVTQTLQVKQGGVLSNVRQSVVWALRDDGWKIQHLHTALIGQPAAEKAPKSTYEIQVLNERIATVAAVLGVAQ